MSRSVLVSSVGALVGGVVGSLVTLYVRPSAQVPKPRAEEPTSPSPADARPGLEEEEAALLRRVQSLERRLSLLTTAYVRAGGTEAEAGQEPSPSQADVADPVFEAAVLDIFDREQERRQDERESRRAEVQKQRTERTASELATKLSLNPSQETKLTELLTAHFESLRELRTSDERPASRTEWRERMASLTQASEQKLKDVLSPGQFAAYQALEPEERIGGGRGSGRAGPERAAPGAAQAGSQRR